MPLSCIALASLICSCGWIATTYLFGFYLSEFSRYDYIYGALAGVIIFLVWMYLFAFIFLSAAEIGRIRMEHMSRTGSSRRIRGQKGKETDGQGDGD
jgi:membrane protein